MYEIPKAPYRSQTKLDWRDNCNKPAIPLLHVPMQVLDPELRKEAVQLYYPPQFSLFLGKSSRE